MNRYVIGLILLMPAHFLFGQTTDTEFWTGGTINLKMHKRFSGQAEQVFKFNDTISHFKSAYSELGLKFKMGRIFSIAANYRYIENPPTKNAQRFSVDFIFNFGKKKFPLSLQYRLRLQHEIRFSNRKTEDYVRNRFRLGYNLCKLVDPYFSCEPFFRLNGKYEFRVARYTIGLDWRITQNLQLTSFYLFQKDVNINRPDKNHIVGLMISYDIRTYKKIRKDKTVPSIK
mgnify:CR=1 FL=1